MSPVVPQSGAGVGIEGPDAAAQPDARLDAARRLGVDPAPFAGRTAVVTGAASGVGAATARMLAARGAGVVIGDVDPRAEDVVAQIMACLLYTSPSPRD